MEAWTVADVEAVLASLQLLEDGIAALRDVLVSIFLMLSMFLGWFLGGALLPSRKDWSA